MSVSDYWTEKKTCTHVSVHDGLHSHNVAFFYTREKTGWENFKTLVVGDGRLQKLKEEEGNFDLSWCAWSGTNCHENLLFLMF